MPKRLIGLIAWRFLRSRKHSAFASFITWSSMCGIALGVISLTVVLSVMNGFDREIKLHTLLLKPHATVEVKGELPKLEGVIRQGYYRQETVLAKMSNQFKPLSLVGTQLQSSKPLIELSPYIVSGRLPSKKHKFEVVIGAGTASNFGIRPGDKLTITLPSLRSTPVGMFPRLKTLKVVGIFRAKTAIDYQSIFVSKKTAELLYRGQGSGAHYGVLVRDPFNMSTDVEHWREHANLTVSSWYEQDQVLFSAVKMEKRVTALMVFAMIAVAAFNIIAALTMQILNKRKAVAILRTQGLSSADAVTIFAIQGAIIGFGGMLLGFIIGIPLAYHFTAVSNWVQNLLGSHLYNASQFYVSWLPSVVMWQDLLVIFVITSFLIVLAIRYPTRRVMGIHPVEALNYD